MKVTFEDLKAALDNRIETNIQNNDIEAMNEGFAIETMRRNFPRPTATGKVNCKIRKTYLWQALGEAKKDALANRGKPMLKKA